MCYNAKYSVKKPSPNLSVQLGNVITKKSNIKFSSQRGSWCFESRFFFKLYADFNTMICLFGKIIPIEI